MALVLLIAAQMAGSAPAAAQFDWTGLLMSEAKERDVAEQEHPKVLAQFGGMYRHPALQAYLDGMIHHLGGNSNRPDIQYRVTILNSPIVNAFALPAGYLYVSRGLLALAENEAEVAGVLAHEIGHVTARHTAQRYGRGVLTSLGIGGLGVLGAIFDAPDLAAALQQMADVGATLYIRSFSRDQELESDRLGVEIMARAGYDPFAVSSFLARLQADARLQAQLIGKPADHTDPFSLLSTHPRTGERVTQAIERAALTPGGRVLRSEEYLSRLDGLAYGDDPEQGLVRGRQFVHPRLGFGFEVPAGFSLANGRDAVTATGPEGALIRFDTAAKPYHGELTDYLAQGWMEGQSLRGLETFDVNGFEAVSAAMRAKPEHGREIDIRLVAIRFDGQTIYRFLFATPPRLTPSLESALMATVHSFRRLGDEEAAAYKARRLRIERVRFGDTPARLAARMPYPDHRIERFAVLNGLDPMRPLQPGRLVKIIVEDE